MSHFYKSLLLLLLLINGSLASNAQVANWTGAVNQLWNEPGNWSWVEGFTMSGIPNENTTVNIYALGVVDEVQIIIPEGFEANVLTIYGYCYPFIQLRDNAILNVYKHITDAAMGSPKLIKISNQHFDDDNAYYSNTSVHFLGNEGQLTGYLHLYTDHLTVNKSNSHLFLYKETNINVRESLNLISSSVPLGSTAHGCIFMYTSNLHLNYNTIVNVSPHTDGKIPPHIVFNKRYTNIPSFNYGHIFETATSVPEQLFFPVGAGWAENFTPIWIGLNDQVPSNYINVDVPVMEPIACASNPYVTEAAVQIFYKVLHGGMDAPLATPYDIQLAFNKDNEDYDVNTFFDIEGDLVLYHFSEMICDYYDESDAMAVSLADGYVYVSKTQVNELGRFAIANLEAEPVAKSLIISVADDAAPYIPFVDGTLDLNAAIYPSDAPQDVVWNVTNISGIATINSDGLLTAHYEGVVRVTASSLQKPSIFDTMYVIIGQELGIAQHQEATFSIATFPNPTKDVLQIVSNTSLQNVWIQIIDINGRIVHSFQNNLEQDQSTPIDLQSLSNGMYLLQINANGQSHNSKFIKQ